MNAFNTATCSHCKQTVRWRGDLQDRPVCSFCGHKPSQEELERVERQLAAIREKLLSQD